MTAGIYGIRHKPTGQIYVGSARVIERRWNEHRANLALGRCDNRALQQAWNTYGDCQFEFVILEEITVDAADEYYNARETYHIAQHENVFNQRRTITTRAASGDKRLWNKYAAFFAIPPNEANGFWKAHIDGGYSDDCEVCTALVQIAEYKKNDYSIEAVLQHIRDESYSAISMAFFADDRIT